MSSRAHPAIGLNQVTITLADARPELIWNQLTGGSNTMHPIFIPVRVAAAIARHQLVEAASLALQEPAYDLTVVGDHVTSSSGRSIGLGALATKAAVTSNRAVQADLQSDAHFTLIGTPQKRIDALDIVTGRKQFAMDVNVPDALPTMVCRPPTINGTATRINNLAQGLHVPQCGYCQPGQIMAAAALIAEKGANVTDADLDTLRNICRCGTYPRIREAIKQAAAQM